MLNNARRNMTNIDVCKENRGIVKYNGYSIEGNRVEFNHTLKEHKEVIVLGPDYLRSLADNVTIDPSGKMCSITVENCDSFKHRTDLVMNFANAHYPGGGYLHGSNAQEECLCRQSTLYASISSNEAKEMYNYNKLMELPMDSHYMLISPCVEVFRDNSYRLLEEPYGTAVITIAAPDRRPAHGAEFVSQSELDSCMIKRLRYCLAAAYHYGYKNLTLGAWGCGAFLHEPENVAGYFKKLLINEEMGRLFDSVLFAVLSTDSKQKNYTAFRKEFEV